MATPENEIEILCDNKVIRGAQEGCALVAKVSRLSWQQTAFAGPWAAHHQYRIKDFSGVSCGLGEKLSGRGRALQSWHNTHTLSLKLVVLQSIYKSTY